MMPRSDRGGRRGRAAQERTPGKKYPNRTDLGMQVAPGQPFGQAAAQQRALAVVPMGAPRTPAPQASPSPGGGSSWAVPGSLGALDRETERPNEPLTAGMSIGPGPGPEALPSFGMGQPADIIRELYRMSPNEELRELLEDNDSGF